MLGKNRNGKIWALVEKPIFQCYSQILLSCFELPIAGKRNTRCLLSVISNSFCREKKSRIRFASFPYIAGFCVVWYIYLYIYIYWAVLLSIGLPLLVNNWISKDCLQRARHTFWTSDNILGSLPRTAVGPTHNKDWHCLCLCTCRHLRNIVSKIHATIPHIRCIHLKN